MIIQRAKWHRRTKKFRMWVLRVAHRHLTLGYCPKCETMGDALKHVNLMSREMGWF